MSPSTDSGELNLRLAFALVCSQGKNSVLLEELFSDVWVGTRSVGKSETIPRLKGLQGHHRQDLTCQGWVWSGAAGEAK